MSGCTLESRRCEFWAQGGAYQRPPCCTLHLKNLLFFTHDLLERHGIPHWLDFGALLGAVRTGEFVPWDGDVDFGVLLEDRERVRALEDDVARAGHWLDMGDPCVWRIFLSRSNLLHADLFPWREEGGLLKMRWPGYPEESWAFPRSFLDDAQPVKLYEHFFPAPAPVHELLARYRYGNEYHVPRRTEEIDMRARIVPSLKAFLARRTFQERLRRNLGLLHETLDATQLRDRYAEMDGGEESRAAADDQPDAAFSYSRGDRALFLDALPVLEGAGFRVLHSLPADDGERMQHRISKEGACFDFVEQGRMDGSV